METGRDVTGQVRLGFACHWNGDWRRTWSGTPWSMRAALAERCDLVDVGVELPRPVREVLRVAGVRRHDGGFQSRWRHGAAAQALVAARLRRGVRAREPTAVLQIGDLAVLDRPYLVVQDLSYRLLLERAEADGIPHFRTLGLHRVQRLQARQIEVLAGAAALLPMSRWLAESLIAEGADAARVHVVPPAANVVLDDSPLPQRRIGRERRLLFIGRDFDTKAGSQVVASLAHVRAELGPGVTLTVAGPPTWPLRGEPPEGVNFLGPVSVAQVQKLYDEHDLFVMPSHFEGYGIVFVEALARGLPCIGRQACAMPEIIRPGVGGALVKGDNPTELAELIVATLADDVLYAACAGAAPSVRASARWDRVADQILAVLDNIG